MGWGWVEHVKENLTGKPASVSGRDRDCGGASNGTNQIGELSAVLQCLREHPGSYPLIIETDSQYAINCSTKWIYGWKKNGWKNSKKEPVKNAELIKAIDAEIRSREGSVQFKWVKGHAGNFYNETVDDLCRGFAQRAGKHQIDGYMPIEGWEVLINGPYSEGLIVPHDKTVRPDNAVPGQDSSSSRISSATTPDSGSNSDSAPIATAAAITSVANPSTSQTTTLIEQPLFNEDNATITEELITRLNMATERFDLAAARLQTASEHMDQAVAKLDEAIRRFDDVSWKNNHQSTLF
ncbi:ribonuclease H [Alloscardovia venturai]|uniref:ribonuclease H n=1 Tax=Alloscardovia venturai TaxID=1769421 RepID=A0ABW2Y1Y9_9BIFI